MRSCYRIPYLAFVILPAVHWTGLGMPAYSFFHGFFKRIRSEAVSAHTPTGTGTVKVGAEVATRPRQGRERWQER